MTDPSKEEITIISPRDMLFGDLPFSHWAPANNPGIPWILFRQAKDAKDKGDTSEAIKLLSSITALPDLESRHYLQAYYYLHQLSSFPEGETLLFGVLVEVAMDEGMDTLVVYADHSARYYNYSGSAIIWDQSDSEIDAKIDELFIQGKEILKNIGPWEGPRPAAPVAGNARLNFLTSRGLHFGEAPQLALFKDPLAGKTMYAMLNMMETLIRKTTKV